MNVKHLPSILLVCSSLAAAAQTPTLTSANNPAVGDWHLQFNTDSFSVGSSGASVTWNFASLVPTTTDTFYYSPCSASPNCSSFPGTTVFGHLQGSSAGIFLHETSTAESVDGEYSTGTIPLSNYEDLLRYPFTYLSTFTDTFVATFTSGSSFYRTGTITVTADAWGSLTLPTRSFTNALRIHRVENYHDSIIGVATFATYATDIYTWYVPGVRSEVLSQTSLTINGSTFPETAYYTNQGSPTSVNAPGILIPGMQVFPNPVNDVINIRFSNTQNAPISISIYDLLGKEVAVITNREYNSGEHVVNYSTAGLAKGLYVLKMQTGEETETRKLILQ